MPSQLKQLKSELARAGLSQQSQPGSSKKRKRAGTLEQDRDKQQAKLQNIHDKFNQFDTKVTKVKHDVAGRKLKGVTGKPTLSKQAGIELVRALPCCGRRVSLIHCVHREKTRS